jgi:hypothetical protein
MSSELLILLAFFTLLPILEQVLRKIRERREQERRRAQGLPPVDPAPRRVPQQAPARRAPAPAPGEQRVPPAHEPVPRPTAPWDEDGEPVVVLPPEARSKPPRRRVKDRALQQAQQAQHRVEDYARERRRLAALRSDAPSPPPPPPPPRRRRRQAGGGLLDIVQTPAAARQGIILMTVLGPCRAVAPHDAPGEARAR